MVKLSVNLVVWNGQKYIPHLFASLKNQTFKGWSLLILDNNSTDQTRELIEKEIFDLQVPVNFIKKEENLGLAGGHNLLIKENESDYILLLNQDIYLAPDCLQKMVEFLDNNPRVAGVSPRLMRWDFGKISEGLEKSFSSLVDALGLKVFRNRRVIEQFTGQDWNVLKNNFKQTVLEVFGVSGALPIFRRQAIKTVLFENGQMFDESYHSYKEDVDLAWRLQLADFRSFVLLDTVAYHDRTGTGSKEKGDMAALKNKQNHTKLVKYHSYKNHLMTLFKNEDKYNFLLDFPFIIWYELKKFLYFLIFDFEILQGLKEIWYLKVEIFKKRQEIKKQKKVLPKTLRKWWK